MCGAPFPHAATACFLAATACLLPATACFLHATACFLPATASHSACLCVPPPTPLCLCVSVPPPLATSMHLCLCTHPSQSKLEREVGGAQEGASLVGSGAPAGGETPWGGDDMNMMTWQVGTGRWWHEHDDVAGRHGESRRGHSDDRVAWGVRGEGMMTGWHGGEGERGAGCGGRMYK